MGFPHLHAFEQVLYMWWLYLIGYVAEIGLERGLSWDTGVKARWGARSGLDEFSITSMYDLGGCEAVTKITSDKKPLPDVLNSW